MKLLSFIEKETIYRLFGISDGYIFKYWLGERGYNKNKTRDLILDYCDINIYEDEPYRDLSQQKCVEKIWDSGNPQTVANLLSGLLDYFRSGMGSDHWDDDDIYDYRQVEEIVERLRAMNTVSLPQQEPGDLRLILNDIESKIREGTPELAVDRLHTFSAQFFRKLCQKHELPIVNDKGENIPLDGLVGKLRRFYEQNNYFESEFCVIAIRNAISIFTQYNNLRNNRSAAHPNPLLQKAEAEYAVRVIADTLTFVDNIEKSKDEEASLPYSFLQIDEELPF